jgi:ABC-type polysaccharide/polyol phosphate export permease
MSSGVYISTDRSHGALGELWRFRALLKNLIVREFKMQHKRSALGLLWVMLNPLITMAMLGLVFSQFFGAHLKAGSFPLYIITGMITWNLFSSITVPGLTSLTSSGLLIRKVYVPKAIFPTASAACGLINFGFSLLTLLAYMLILQAPIKWTVVLAPVPILCLSLFALGLSMTLGTLHVFFRDVRWFYESALLAWFYATPIFYPTEIISAEYIPLMKLNPLWPMLKALRATIMYGAVPSTEDVIASVAWALIALAAGWLTLRRFDQDIINHL